MRLLFIIFLFASQQSFAQYHHLVIKAGDFDRTNTPIQFQAPSFYTAIINSQTNDTITIHSAATVTPFEQAFVFVLDQPMKAGTERAYILYSGNNATQSRLDIDAINIDDRLNYNITTQYPDSNRPDYYKRSGFFHPVKTPNGITLTDGFPVGHTHQHGVFNAWVNTTFRGEKVDFWNQQSLTGTVKSKSKPIHIQSNQQYSSFQDELLHLQVDSVQEVRAVVLQERWQVNTITLPKYQILDINSTKKNITADTLFINKYHYGGMGFRGSATWNEVDSVHFESNMKILTSEGKTRANSNHTRPKWICAYGTIKGEAVGVLALNHPSNFRFPQPVRVHPTMPYFCFFAGVEEAFTIAPNQVYDTQYRFITFDGAPDAALFEQLWQDYAFAPSSEVTIKR